MKEPKIRSETRTYTLPRDIVKKLQLDAKETERTESEMVRYIIKQYYKEGGQIK